MVSPSSPERATDTTDTTSLHDSGATARRLALHLLVTLLVSGGAFVLFLLVLWGVKENRHPITAGDHHILLWMGRHHNPILTLFARALAHLGEPKVIIGIGLIGALLGYFYRPIRGAAWTMPIAIIGAGVLIQGVKMEFRRVRPDVFTPLLRETGYSFPSGHSLIAVVVYGLLGCFLIRLTTRRVARGVIMAVTVAVVLAIGISRVYVGVHYPSDVLAGWTLGIPWLVGCLALVGRLNRYYAGQGEPGRVPASGGKTTG